MGKQTQEVFYAEAAVQSRLFKKSVSRNFAEFPPPKKKKKKKSKKIKENGMAGIYFLKELNSEDLQLY